MPKMKMNTAANTTGMAMMMTSMTKGDAAARQHALEQFRIGDRIVGVRLELDRHADPSRSAVGHGQNILTLSLAVFNARMSRWRVDGLAARGTVIVAESRLCRAASPGRACGEASALRTAQLKDEGMSVTIADIEAARRTIAGQVLRTPMLPAPKLSALTGAEVFVKYENLQVTNSFKERGALNKLASLEPPSARAASSPCRPATTRRRWPIMPRGSASRPPSSCR